VSTRNGDPEVSELPSVQGYSWATLSPGGIHSDTWSCRLEVGRGANNTIPEKTEYYESRRMPAERNQLRQHTVGHSKGGQGLKRAVVTQKKKAGSCGHGGDGNGSSCSIKDGRYTLVTQ
jgi:hypothetical protein